MMNGHTYLHACAFLTTLWEGAMECAGLVNNGPNSRCIKLTRSNKRQLFHRHS